MSPDLLGTALGILCAFSSGNDCQRAQSIPIKSAPVMPLMNATAVYESFPRVILVDDRETNPAIVATLLFHEITHDEDYQATLGQRRNRAFCQMTEDHAYHRQLEIWTWFVHTFGQPVPTDKYVIAFNEDMYRLPSFLNVNVTESCRPWAA